MSTPENPTGEQHAPATQAAPLTGGTRSSQIIEIEGAPRQRPIWTQMGNPFVTGFLLVLGGLAAWVLGGAIANLSLILIYISFALFIALGLDPVVRWIERRGIKRGGAVGITVGAFVLIVAGALAIVIPMLVQQITNFVTNAPTMIRDFQNSDFYTWLLDRFGDAITNATTEIQRIITDPGTIAKIGGGAIQIGASIFSGISGVVIVLVLVLYFVAMLPIMKTSMYRLAPARSRARFADLTEQITESVGSYLSGMVILALINALFVLVCFLFINPGFAVLMAVVAFLITLIPLVGTIISWVIGSLVALFTSPIAALVFAILYLIYMQVEAYVLTPRIMGRAVSVPGPLVIIGALVGGTLLGLLGALIAIPVTASILIIIKQVWIPRQDLRV